MRKNKILFTLCLAFVLSFSFISCNKEPVNPTVNQPTGTVSGFTYYNLSNGNQAPLKDVAVSIENTSFNTSTDSNGIYVFKNVPAGSYTLSYHKDGYGDVKQFNFLFLGNGQGFAQPIGIRQIPRFSFYNLNDSLNLQIFGSDTNFTLNGVFYIKNPDSLNPMSYMVVFGLTKNITLGTPNQISSFQGAYVMKNYKLNYFSFIGNDIINYLRQNSIPIHGTTIYLKIYPVPAITSSSYYYSYDYDYLDPLKGPQYTSIGQPVSGQFVIQ